MCKLLTICLVALQTLSLNSCGLRPFPPAIKDLAALTFLDLGSNYGVGASLAALPADALSKLTGLCQLSIRHCGHSHEVRRFSGFALRGWWSASS